MNVKEFLVERAIKVLIAQLDKPTIEDAIASAITKGENLLDAIIDKAKEKIKESDTQLDDRILLPVLEMVEQILGLPED
jgi:hypothetical protein